MKYYYKLYILNKIVKCFIWIYNLYKLFKLIYKIPLNVIKESIDIKLSIYFSFLIILLANTKNIFTN
jgi:hypothetical protein